MIIQFNRKTEQVTSNLTYGIILSVFTCLVIIPIQLHADDARTPAKKQHQTAPIPSANEKYMVSVTLHKQEELESLLNRADNLSKTMRANGNTSSIALILHGPEIRYFSKKNYKVNSNIVDKAARLDGDKIIEIKVCKSKMDELGIKDQDIPSFVEIIPYAPEEEEKLLKKGYVYL